ncbi:transcription factor bHLH7 [Cocos nucifera]|uniref:Transcription factor bHLH7 n=1 Tax=Cocos nucifera TaxID=13894 RepID=A0A8K0IZN9_COCNU|nr:transcription factor bHLH7 [Cocos nucifera]
MSAMVPLPEQFRDASGNLVTASGNEKYPISQHVFPPQFHYLQVHGNHVSLLSTTSVSCGPIQLRAIPAGDILEGVILPTTSFDAGKDISGFQTYSAYDNSRFSDSPLLNQLNKSSIPDIGTSRVNQTLPAPTSINTETASDFSNILLPIESDDPVEDMVFPLIGYSVPSSKEKSASMPKNAENEFLPQSYTSIQQKPDDDSDNSAEPSSKIMLSSREARAQAAASRRLHRARVTEGIKALQNCIPSSDKCNKESVLDDIIDYIKFLKLQLKALCQSRLSGEATLYPFVHIEGYGHYLLHQQMCGEPLEEMMGQLMISNMNSANELFESKGLSVLPMTLAYALLHIS